MPVDTHRPRRKMIGGRDWPYPEHASTPDLPRTVLALRAKSLSAEAKASLRTAKVPPNTKLDGTLLSSGSQKDD